MVQMTVSVPEYIYDYVMELKRKRKSSKSQAVQELISKGHQAVGDRGKSGYTLNPKTSENVRNITAYT